ncbi:MAG: hypothetical protein CMG13_07175 [Candidatus Marinimicrobia bacterium]|nr:hypothetical protein [Candidatus Neomarinimicrobiota bacterium]|tara:strand:+ start:625 stop:1332 length:708 start_codon:yes stop_codon:yes gene_type:complete
MNNIYIFLFLTTTILISEANAEPSDINNKADKTEQEKDINEENLYSKINREIDFYSYDISIGQSIPINKNTADNFRSGGSMSIHIKTPYRSPKILNRLIFNISSEISIKNFRFKADGDYNSNYNIFTIYLILNNLDKKRTSLSYGTGISHISQSNKSSLSPALKLNLEHTIDFNRFYTLLTNNHILNKKEAVENFLNKLNISIGISPELILGFPHKRGQSTLSSEINFKVNLFNL